MSDGENGVRTHEPNIRELTADLDGLREVVTVRFAAIEKLAEERDKWYAERDRNGQTAVDKALAAVKEQTSSSFAASKEAILKAEDSQKSYNVGHNDLSRKMEDQYKQMVPYSEARLKWDSMDREIAALREMRSNVTGKGEGISTAWGLFLGAMALLGGIVTTGLALYAALKP
jgi:hypothetical protein